MNIRLATATDIPAMIDLERQSETAAHWTEGQYQSALPACGAALTARLVLVIDGENALAAHKGTIAGFLVAQHQGPEWEVENIVVTSEARRKGVGSRLLEEFLRRAKSAGSKSVHLEVRGSNNSARAFYERWGFEETGRRKGYYANPAEDAILYRRIVDQKGLKTRP